jgi:hypothetical protein
VNKLTMHSMLGEADDRHLQRGTEIVKQYLIIVKYQQLADASKV